MVDSVTVRCPDPVAAKKSEYSHTPFLFFSCYFHVTYTKTFNKFFEPTVTFSSASFSAEWAKALYDRRDTVGI